MMWPMGCDIATASAAIRLINAWVQDVSAAGPDFREVSKGLWPFFPLQTLAAPSSPVAVTPDENWATPGWQQAHLPLDVDL